MFLDKKIFFSIVLAAVLLGGGLFVASKNVEKTEQVSGSQAVKNTSEIFSINSSGIGKDSDEDGLLDWEETLWGTDKNKKDSDEDGTEDGKEVSLSRDPAKAGPDDFLEEKKSDSSGSEENQEITTETGAVAVELLSRYINAKNSGGLSAEESSRIQERIINSFAGNINSKRGLPKFLSEDISVVASSKENIKKYGNDLGSIFSKYGHDSVETPPIDVLIEVLQTRNKKRAEDLLIWADDYISAAEEIADVPTPKVFLSAHLDFVNNLYRTGKNLESLGGVLRDPLESLGSLSLFLDNTVALANSVFGLKENIIKNGVNYSPSEDGYLLLNGI